jgi:hypothetical protein
MSDPSLDEPVPDLLDQRTDAVLDADDLDETELPDVVPLEADAADTAEQAREVGLGEEEYR